MKLAILIIFSYLLGSVPFGLLIAKAHGKDLRTIGSGNIGATNVSRALGKKFAYICFVLDVLKGLVPMLIAMMMLKAGNWDGVFFFGIWFCVGCAAIIGHIFPVYLRFKGGKGVATSLGMVLGLWPYYTIAGVAAFAVWIICVLRWRYVSLASIVAGIVFPITFVILTALLKDWHFNQLWPLLIASLVMLCLLIFRHKDNIKRLMAGTEQKITRRSRPAG